jgi:hypothetical protein
MRHREFCNEPPLRANLLTKITRHDHPEFAAAINCIKGNLFWPRQHHPTLFYLCPPRKPPPWRPPPAETCDAPMPDMAKRGTVPKLRPLEPTCGVDENCCPDPIAISRRELKVDRAPIEGPTVKLRWTIVLRCLVTNRPLILGASLSPTLPPLDVRVALSTEGL